MKLLRNLENLPDDLRHGAITIGNFDGVHLGHARIVRQLVAEARRVHGPAVVFTFDPHPARILRPGNEPQRLCRLDRKARLLDALGADALVAFPTTGEFLRLEAKAFFEEVICRAFVARAVVEGPNFFFGKGRAGNIDLLGRFCREAEIAMTVVEPVDVGGQIVSSSRIRTLLAQGEVDQVRRMLTRPYRVYGTVERGAGRGKSLGFPTANLTHIETLLPREGIYAGRAWVDGQPWPAAISMGGNPTFGEHGMKIEAHLVGYAGHLYGRQIEVDFLARLREILRFESVDELVAQIDRDVASVRQIARAAEC